MSSKEALLKFAKTLAGHYSNFEQSQDNPKDFAHINIFFRPLPWETLKGPGFYSEQSYDHDLWSPYRQGIHRLTQIEDVFVVENFVGAFVVADAVAVAVVVAGVVVVVAVVVVELVHIRPNSYGVCHHSLAFPLVLRDVGAPKW